MLHSEPKVEKRETPNREFDAAHEGIREARKIDIAAIVDVHKQAFSGFFLTQLGDCFLVELYRGFLSDEKSVCLVVDRDKSVIGFAVGTTEPSRFFRRLLVRRGFHFLIAAVPALIKHPLAIGQRLLSALSYRGESQQMESNGALLSSLAVSPKTAGRGEGSALVRAFCRVAKSRGAESVYLSTDSNNNEKVNTFYQHHGFRCHFQYEKLGGRGMNCYVLRLAPEPLSGDSL